MISPTTFQQLIFQWFDAHGRKQLPWQFNKTPYRVWISEIMLQQTQVNTVIPYFEKFMQQFPTVSALARATEDAVLHLWAGLGYYSRARNLHRAANIIMQDFGGQFPNTLETIQQLPGIGTSTAGAIFSIAFNQPAAILDGNVKRVLARFHGICEPIDDPKTVATLWNIAKQYSPTTRTADYTQAIMDLGATLCTRRKPQCEHCPMTKYCQAHRQGTQALLPTKKPKRILPIREATFLILKNNHEILLYKRPSKGIWGGLWSLPEIKGQPNKKQVHRFCQQQFNLTVKRYQPLASFRHTFTHYHLDIFPITIDLAKKPPKNMEDIHRIWYNLLKPTSIGLPKPIQSIIRAFK